MKEIILHIGHGNTGSSYLQSVLALNRDKLLDLGMDYPENNSFERAKRGEISSGNASVFFKNYFNLESITDKERILFSNEGFLFKLINGTKEFKSEFFVKFCEKYGKRLKVILFTRNLFQLRFSSWAQVVKRSSGISDVDTFLKERPIEKHHFLISDWLNLSRQFGFRLIIKNYSNHKDNLLNIFLKELIGEKANIENFILPTNTKVNRSLTFSEYEVQRICNFLNKSKPPLSDLLVNQFPDIKSMDIKCSKKTYDIVKNANIEMINIINNQIDKNESIKIESLDTVIQKESDIQPPPLTEDQIKTIASYLEKNNSNIKTRVDDLYTNQIRDIAIKIANKQSLDLSNALSLMKVAQLLRPQAPFIKSKVEEWEAELNL